MAEVSQLEMTETTQEPKEHTGSPKRMKLEDPSGPNLRQIKDAERKAERERKEAEKLAEKLRKEAEKRAEKERKEKERREEKERKEQQRQAEKARKEKVRLAEKERKEAEKQAEKERKEQEKEAERLLKKSEKEAERERKLKAQPPINLFFKKSDTTPEPSATLGTSSGSDYSEPDYKKFILPFHVKIDGKLYSTVCNYEPESPSEYTMDPREWLQRQAQHHKSARKSIITSQEFQRRLALVQESSQVSSLLSQIRIRRLQFSHLSTRHIEDPHASVNAEFRPPYVGSTKDIDITSRKLLAQDPFRTDLDNTMAYEYDSEAEWDPEEGEDLNEDDDIESDEEMEDNEELKEFFTSDDEDSSNKRPRIVGPLTPVIVWGRKSDLDPFKILVNGIIDPYKPTKQSISVQPNATEQQPQKEQSEYTIDSMMDSLATKLDIDALKRALESHINSTGTKTLIVELLKQQFPNALDKEIRQLFDMCMERVGKKRTEKRWVFTPAATTYFKP